MTWQTELYKYYKRTIPLLVLLSFMCILGCATKKSEQQQDPVKEEKERPQINFKGRQF